VELGETSAVLSLDQVLSNRVADEADNVRASNLHHPPATMPFHCPATDLQLVRDLLIGSTRSYELNYLNLANT
jgi:hypothetical protein